MSDAIVNVLVHSTGNTCSFSFLKNLFTCIRLSNVMYYYNLNTESENILNKEYGANNKSQPTFPFVLSLSAQADITNGSLTAKQHIMS